MLRLLFIIFSMFFLLLSCAKQKPKGIISEKKMTQLLTEVSLIDAYLNNLSIDSGRKVMPVLYANLFKEFGIDSAEYVQNLDFYYGNPKLSEKIYIDIHNKLMDYDKALQVEDSIRNMFVNDSIRQISRIQQLDQERRNNTLYYYRDSLEYTYKEASKHFYSLANLYLQAYGIQTLALPSIKQYNPILEEAILQDSVLRKYLDVPVHRLLLEKPKDSTKVDFRFLNIYFLRAADLNVRTGYTYSPILTLGIGATSSSTDRIEFGQIPADLVNQDLKPIELNNEQTGNMPQLNKPEKSIENPKRLLSPTVH